MRRCGGSLENETGPLPPLTLKFPLPLHYHPCTQHPPATAESRHVSNPLPPPHSGPCILPFPAPRNPLWSSRLTDNSPCHLSRGQPIQAHSGPHTTGAGLNSIITPIPPLPSPHSPPLPTSAHCHRRLATEPSPSTHTDARCAHLAAMRKVSGCRPFNAGAHCVELDSRTLMWARTRAELVIAHTLAQIVRARSPSTSFAPRACSTASRRDITHAILAHAAAGVCEWGQARVSPGLPGMLDRLRAPHLPLL